MKICLILTWILLTEATGVVQSHTDIMCFRNRYDTSTICKQRSNELSCKQDEVIKINTIQYAKNKYWQLSCSRCSTDATVQNWKKSPSSLRKILYQLCSMQSSCSFENVKTPSPDGNEYNYLWLAYISYDCVSSGLINDICLPWESALGANAGAIYLSLNGRESILQQCSCIVEGDVDQTSITVIDYRPFYKDSTCTDSFLSFDGKRLLQCLSTLESDSSAYNTPINITKLRTIITLTIHHMLPQMVWIAVKGLDVSVQCNTFDNTQQTSVSTSTKPTGTTFSTAMISLSTELIADETTDSFATDITTTVSKSQHGNKKGSSGDVPYLAIAGALVGLVALVSVVTTAVLPYRRRSRRLPESRSSEAVYYNVAPFKARETEKPEESMMNCGINLALEKGDELYVNTSNSSNSSPQVQEVYRVNLNMIRDEVLCGAGAKHTEEISINTKRRNESKFHGNENEEPYYKNLTRGGDQCEINYCKL
ncbi:uncharacterized protein LOC123553237 [Mercenaria mercenaria]|uniref:uncharacterized protein LOC123553237 n=1 Tax=Mercenaria mercenaria TaxID=6596 RepID=UPI00234ED8C5|nr:uncharacterized protein LOC123553237 [Mercenaria mercenaria]